MLAQYMGKSMKRDFFLITCLLLMVIATACTGSGGDSAAEAEPTVTPIPTAPAAAKPTYVVQRGTVQEILAFSGRWQPRDQM